MHDILQGMQDLHNEDGPQSCRLTAGARDAHLRATPKAVRLMFSVRRRPGKIKAQKKGKCRAPRSAFLLAFAF